MSADHVVVDCTDGSIRCLRCGGYAPLPLPIAIDRLQELADRWIARHRDCPIPTPTRKEARG